MKHFKSIIIFYGLLFVLSLGLSYYLGILGIFFQNINMPADIFLGFFLSIPIIVLSIIMTRKTALFNELIRFIIHFFNRFSVSEIFFVALASGIGEELLFRGFLQHYLGIFWSSLLFGMLHVGPSRKFLGWTLFAFFVGLYLGFAQKIMGNLIIPIVAHFFINFINILLNLKCNRQFIAQEQSRQRHDEVEEATKVCEIISL